MDWSEERWIKVYTRDTADWLALSWRAQGLLKLIERKADAAGALHLGRQGRRGVAACVGHAAAWPELEPALEELERDGWVRVEGDKLLVVAFVEAQEARASQRARKKTERERNKAGSASRDVTHSHAASRDVTTRVEEKRVEEKEAAAGSPPAAAPEGSGPEGDRQPPPPAAGDDGKPSDFASAAKVGGDRPPPQAPPKPPRQPSRQELLWGRLRDARAEVLPDAPEDPGPGHARLNALLGDAVAQLGEADVERAWSEYLRDPWALKLDLPCPLRAFTAEKRAECLARARKRRPEPAQPAANAEPGPVVAWEPFRPPCPACGQDTGGRGIFCAGCQPGWAAWLLAEHGLDARKVDGSLERNLAEAWVASRARPAAVPA